MATKTKKEERAEKGQRYSTIDHHVDLTANGGYTVSQRTPFHFRVLGLTEMAKKILEEAKSKNK